MPKKTTSHSAEERSAAELAELKRSLLEQIPDDPLHLEARHLLLLESSRIVGCQPGHGGGLVWDPHDRLIAVIGRPATRLFAEAARAAGAADPAAAAEAAGRTAGWTLLAPLDMIDRIDEALPDWGGEEAVIYRHDPKAESAPETPGADLRRVEGFASGELDHLPADLRAEVEGAVGQKAMAAAWVDGRPVCFCYPFRETESLWDVSVDTLEPYRRRGLAYACVRFLAGELRRAAKEPVWGALESNAASLALAEKLGFRPVGRILVMSPG